MNERKAYASPAVLTEDLLEQTSLACNATVGVNGGGAGTFGPGVADPVCTIDVSKNNAFATAGVCRIVLGGANEVVALS